ncbi:MAG: rhodanese-like domain-containing protein [Burkholderiales bacterium]|jgi:rhodanese-related sulfurtransferase|nr:rhodanese-like domain-containing protein [Burkholderiales bacterium]
MLRRCALTVAPLPPSLLKTTVAVLLSCMSMLTVAATEPVSLAQTTQTAPTVVTDEGCLLEPAAVTTTTAKVLSPPVPVPVLDHSCWIGYAEAEKRSPLWVDVRSLPETRAAPMSGALQIPLHQISTKTFLKEMPAVLIGNGADDAEMAMVCHQLKEAGFAQLRLLRHGARAWYRAGQPLLGNAETIMALDTIDAGYFLRGQVAQVWRVIGVDLPTEALAQLSASPSSTFVGTALDAKAPDQTIDKIRTLVREWRRTDAGTSAHVPTTIIVAADETATHQLRQRWRELSDVPDNDVLWLTGGWRDYVAFVEQQRRMAAIAANPPPLRHPCGS